MKAIDLHIHTVPTLSDSKFDFSMATLIDYIENMELDIIGVTNHNIFNIEQFKQIVESVNIKVLPGIEINFEGGHLLLISENTALEDFYEKCKKVESKIKNVDDFITKNELFEIYGDLDNYLLIPHHPKKPKVPINIINELSDYIDAIEVSSIKDFLREYKENKKYVPLWFSDVRIKKNATVQKVGRTFLDIDETSLKSIKIALLHRQKVKLSINESNKLFPINNNGLQISTGLNVLMGARSSGKTHFLNDIEKYNENVKYIKQFSLIDQKEFNEKSFNSRLNNEYGNVGKNKFLDFQKLIEEIYQLDIQREQKKINDYVESLIKFATEEERRDVFSKSKLYSENSFQIKDVESLDNLINSIKNIIDNTEYYNIITKHIETQQLKQLILELANTARNICKENNLKRQANEVIIEIKQKLEIKTASNRVKDINFRDYLESKNKIEKFNHICDIVKESKIVQLEKIGKFNLVMKTGMYERVSQIKESIKTSASLLPAFKSSYSVGYNYIQELKKLDLPLTDYWQCFVKVRYDLLNEFDLSASGGERAEYNLLHEIKSSHEYDILLIDEPESSFDNIFLNKEVNCMIKDISKKMPVVLATHNNTSGLSIQPDYILYAKRESVNKEALFKIYYGNLDSKFLNAFGFKNDKISTRKVLLDSLEAGNKAYDDRRKIYELFKD